MLGRFIDITHKAEVMDVCITEFNEKAFIDGIHEDGENKLGLLIEKLMTAGRNADALKAATDEDARKQFYIEFGM